MAETKRRQVSNPRLLAAIDTKANQHGLGDDTTLDELRTAVMDDIVADATRDYRPTINEAVAKAAKK